MLIAYYISISIGYEHVIFKWRKLTTTHNSFDEPEAHFEGKGGCEDTSRSGKGLRPLHP